MNTPVRLQRTRTDRASIPTAIYVGRGSRWANPFRSDRFGHARATGIHRAWLAGRISLRTILSLGFNDREAMALMRLRIRILQDLHLLIGRDLICWCNLGSKWCHGDTLIAAANPIAIAA